MRKRARLAAKVRERRIGEAVFHPLTTGRGSLVTRGQHDEGRRIADWQGTMEAVHEAEDSGIDPHPQGDGKGHDQGQGTLVPQLPDDVPHTPRGACI